MIGLGLCIHGPGSPEDLDPSLVKHISSSFEVKLMGQSICGPSIKVLNAPNVSTFGVASDFQNHPTLVIPKISGENHGKSFFFLNCQKINVAKEILLTLVSLSKFLKRFV